MLVYPQKTIQEVQPATPTQKENIVLSSMTGAKGVFSLNSYRNGYFEIQDFASNK